MAADNIDFNFQTNQFGQELRAYFNALRKVNQDGPNILSAITHMVDGDGSQAAHFAELVAKGIYPTNEDAIASYNEIASVNAKLTTNEPVTAVNDAINQICAKHGVI